MARACGAFVHRPQCARSALQRGWQVEVWSWRDALSSNYRRLKSDAPPGRLTLHFLDAYADAILS